MAVHLLGALGRLNSLLQAARMAVHQCIKEVLGPWLLQAARMAVHVHQKSYDRGFDFNPHAWRFTRPELQFSVFKVSSRTHGGTSFENCKMSPTFN